MAGVAILSVNGQGTAGGTMNGGVGEMGGVGAMVPYARVCLGSGCIIAARPGVGR